MLKFDTMSGVCRESDVPDALLIAANEIPGARNRKKSKQKKSRHPQNFVNPDTMTHFVSPTDSIQYFAIHYATTIQRLKELNPGKDASSLLLSTKVTVPWPKVEAPCLTCTAHSWCTAVRAASSGTIDGNNDSDVEAVSRRNSAQNNMALLRAAEDNDTIDAAAVAYAENLLSASRSNSGEGTHRQPLTYSRVKIKVQTEFGDVVAERVKPHLRGMLERLALENDKMFSDASAAEASDGYSAGIDADVEGTDDDTCKPHSRDRVSTRKDSAIVPGKSTGTTEPSWANTCVYGAAIDNAHVGVDADSSNTDCVDVAAPIRAQDVDDMKFEVEHWHAELKKITGDTEEDDTLRLLLRAKIGKLEAELRHQGALLGGTAVDYFKQFDAKFSAARTQAEHTLSAKDEACSCCGVVLRPGAKFPQGCSYAKSLGTTWVPENASGNPQPGVATRIAPPAPLMTSAYDFADQYDEGALYEL
eukprot:m.236927 g.236927  ORF g.236927 m.236927 type:complete len:474 (+) comp19360_c0_seq1:263-1684(+)